MVALTILLGILTIVGLFLTTTFGVMMTKGKKTFALHKWFAFLTLLLAIIHTILVISKYYY